MGRDILHVMLKSHAFLLTECAQQGRIPKDKVADTHAITTYDRMD